MTIVIDFYRTRDADDAHAVVGRETAEVPDLDRAIEIARQLWRTLDMPQRADAVTITDGNGETLYSADLEVEERRDRCKDGRPRDRSTPTTRKRIAPSTREN